MTGFSNYELKTFVGYSAKDAEISYYESGNCKATFSLPLKKNKNDEPLWLNIQAWGNLAESVSEKVKRGSKVIVVGTLSTSEYNGKTNTYLNLEHYNIIGA